jgi:hypothetical protein
MYPSETLLDEFMTKKGIHKDPKNIVKIQNGKVVLNKIKKDVKVKRLFNSR